MCMERPKNVKRKVDERFVDHLKLPDNYIFDNEARELFRYYLCNVICTKEAIKEREELKVGVYLAYNCPIEIKYNNKWYYVALVKNTEDNCCYWYMRPYNKSWFTTKANKEDTTFSFNLVIQAVIDNDKLFNK